jgi:hypothetical protein
MQAGGAGRHVSLWWICRRYCLRCFVQPRQSTLRFAPRARSEKLTVALPSGVRIVVCC